MECLCASDQPLLWTAMVARSKTRQHPLSRKSARCCICLFYRMRRRSQISILALRSGLEATILSGQQSRWRHLRRCVMPIFKQDKRRSRCVTLCSGGSSHALILLRRHCTKHGNGRRHREKLYHLLLSIWDSCLSPQVRLHFSAPSHTINTHSIRRYAQWVSHF